MMTKVEELRRKAAEYRKLADQVAVPGIISVRAHAFGRMKREQAALLEQEADRLEAECT